MRRSVSWGGDRRCKQEMSPFHERVGAYYGILWKRNRSTDEIVAESSYGAHSFVLASKSYRFQRGEGYVGRIYDSVTTLQQFDVLLDTSAVDDGNFIRKHEALASGISSIVFVPQLDGGLLELGFESAAAAEAALALIRCEMIPAGLPAPMQLLEPAGRLNAKPRRERWETVSDSDENDNASSDTRTPSLDSLHWISTASDVQSQTDDTAQTVDSRELDPFSRGTSPADTSQPDDTAQIEEEFCSQEGAVCRTRTPSPERSYIHSSYGAPPRPRVFSTELPYASMTCDSLSSCWSLQTWVAPPVPAPIAHGEDFVAIDALVPLGLPSVGSIGHHEGCCKPECKYLWTKDGCSYGESCDHCHLCTRRRKFHRRKWKVEAAQARALAIENPQA